MDQLKLPTTTESDDPICRWPGCYSQPPELQRVYVYSSGEAGGTGEAVCVCRRHLVNGVLANRYPSLIRQARAEVAATCRASRGGPRPASPGRRPAPELDPPERDPAPIAGLTLAAAVAGVTLGCLLKIVLWGWS